MSLIIGVDDERVPKAGIGEKVRELCEALLNDEVVIEARNRVEAFLSDPEAAAGYAKLARRNEELQYKEMSGQPVTEAEAAEFESLRDEVFRQPAVQEFARARGALQEVQSFVMAYVSRTLELGRIPSDRDFAGEDEGCGHGCGCHH